MKNRLLHIQVDGFIGKGSYILVNTYENLFYNVTDMYDQYYIVDSRGS